MISGILKPVTSRPGATKTPRSTLREGDRAHPRGGIIRAPRRPSGWRAPGPAPAGSHDDPSLAPGPNEDLCFLTGDWRIFQRLDGHRWSLDDLVTAWVAIEARRDRPPATACDLGCGIGSVLMMTAWAYPHARLRGIEAQTLSLAMARRSLRYNGADDRVEVVEGDLRDPGRLPVGPFDLVTGTPPYFDVERGVVSDRPQRGPCRFELRGGVEAYVDAAARILATDGVFVVCEDSRQRARVEVALAGRGLAVQARLDVVPRAGKPPLFSVFTCVREPAPTPAVLERLVVRARDGRRTSAFIAVREAMGLPA